MKVILLEELKGRGGEGDVIEVATGYAVNFLFPKKIAIMATKGNLKQLELRRHNIAKREADRLDGADKLMASLEGKTIKIGAKVGEEGQLFGSITPVQIAEAIAENFNTEVDRRKIDIHGLIKTAGQHEVTISIYRDVKATLIVDVVDEKALNQTPESEEVVAEVTEEAEIVVAEITSEASEETAAEAALAEESTEAGDATDEAVKEDDAEPLSEEK